MAQKLSKQAQGLLDQVRKNLILILEVEGISKVFGSSEIMRYWRVGDEGLEIGDDLIIGGTTPNPDSMPLIDIKKSTKTISQQLSFESGGSSSVQTMNIFLSDIGGIAASILKTEGEDRDILGRKATVSIGFKEGSHPEDSFVIFRGVITGTEYGTGNIILNIAHPQKLEEVELFVKRTTVLSQALLIGETEAHAEIVDGFELNPKAISDYISYKFGAEFKTYLRINDEIMQYEQIVEDENGYFFGVTRAQFRTIEADHEIDDDIELIYKLKGDSITLALMLLLSSPGTIESESESVSMIGFVSPEKKVQNSVSFFGVDVEQEHGIVIGDLINISGAVNSQNNGSKEIKEIVQNDFGSYVVVSGTPLIDETTENITCKFISQYNVLNDGVGLTTKEVDVAKFLYEQKILGSSVMTQDFTLEDSVNAKDFINTQILRPSGLLQIPRLGKVSCASTLPPIADGEIVKIDESNILTGGLSKMVTTRSLNKNFYNTVLWRFNEDEFSGKLKQTEIYIDEESYAKTGSIQKVLEVEARGVKRDYNSLEIIKTVSKNTLNRYKKAAQALSVPVNIKAGLNIDIADTVIFDGSKLSMTDIAEGARGLRPKMMQVIDKEMGVGTSITLKLLDVNFSTGARYGVIAPSSEITSGNIGWIKLKGIISDSIDSEFFRWKNFIGEKVIVRSFDWSKVYETTLLGFDEVDRRKCYIDDLPAWSSDLLYLEIPAYDETDSRELALYKQLFAFINPTVTIESGVDSISFNVPLQEVERFTPGTYVNIHSVDYSDDFETQVLSIDGQTVTVEKDLGFTPTSSHVIDLIGFLDGGFPYRII